MKNKRKKLGAAGLTFLALLSGVIGVTAASTTLVSCNKDTIPATHKVVLNTSNVEITEQKILDNGDLQVTFSLGLDKTKKVYGIVTSAIVRNKNQAGKILTENTDYTVTIGKDKGIVLLKCDSFKNYTDETIQMSITVIPRDKTNKEKFIDRLEELCDTFNKSTTEYTPEQITWKRNNEEMTNKNIIYKTENEVRYATLEAGDDNTCSISSTFYYVWSSGLKDTATYVIKEDILSYSDNDAGDGEFKKLAFNKNGYLTECSIKIANIEITDGIEYSI